MTLGRSLGTACLKGSQMPLLHHRGLHFCCGLMYNFISKLSHETYYVTAYSRRNIRVNAQTERETRFMARGKEYFCICPKSLEVSFRMHQNFNPLISQIKNHLLGLYLGPLRAKLPKQTNNNKKPAL